MGRIVRVSKVVIHDIFIVPFGFFALLVTKASVLLVDYLHPKVDGLVKVLFQFIPCLIFSSIVSAPLLWAGQTTAAVILFLAAFLFHFAISLRSFIKWDAIPVNPEKKSGLPGDAFRQRIKRAMSEPESKGHLSLIASEEDSKS